MWKIIESSFIPASQHHKETIFTIGNGYLCTRGAFEEGYPNDRRATFIHGVFDDAPTVITELANAPDWLPLTILLNGEKFSLQNGKVLAYERQLDLRKGLLTRIVRWMSPRGVCATLMFERFCSLADEHLLSMRCQVIPEFDGTVEFRAALNGNTDNDGLAHWQATKQGLRHTANGAPIAYLCSRTRASGIDVAMTMRLMVDSPADTDFWDVESIPTLTATFPVRSGEAVRVVKFVGVATSRDTDEPLELACASVSQASAWEKALLENQQVWEQEWERTEVTIEGDEQAQTAVRFSLFQLLIAAPRKDNRVNIGAKTLSGFGYRGHAFWDTEIFMLPVFTYTAPHIARNLLDYRYLTLDAARSKARLAGFEGAWFAWESATTGEEVTPTWVRDLKDPKKLARVWTGDLAIHISADIAYAAHTYWHVTGDDEWFSQKGAELILDTARFYVSRAKQDAAQGCYGYYDVVGPDEYHDHVNNNAYTNLMAKWNIQTGLQVWDWLTQHHPGIADRFSQALALYPGWQEKWRRIAEGICLRMKPDGLIEQFDGFFNLKDVNLADYEPRTKSMHEIFGVEAANDYQVLKQPDVLMLQFLLRDQFSSGQIRANYDYYTPRTDHSYGSSLGPSIQAIVACMMGEPEEAYAHFIRSARADLDDVRGNAGDGIHGASAGGLWQAVVFGFGGLRCTPDKWTIHPCLPSHWKSLSFRFFHRGAQQIVRIANK